MKITAGSHQKKVVKKQNSLTYFLQGINRQKIITLPSGCQLLLIMFAKSWQRCRQALCLAEVAGWQREKSTERSTKKTQYDWA